ncbi:MAG: hypothetical protein M1812_004253 [Candelaria pacifica]|nr:MAG: hypothetical protein M1812_004253 [Candelaria pacifica]
MPTKSPFAGGWSSDKAKRLEAIPLPDKIKCLGCKRIRVQSAYSKKQLRDLRDIIYSEGDIDCTKGAYIKCRQCTGQQVNEMTCCVCDAVKGLSGFSKAQRRDPDKARCLDCVAVHIDTDPDYEADSDVSNPYEDDDHKSGAEDGNDQQSHVNHDTVEDDNLEWFDSLSLTQQNLDNGNATASASQWSGNWNNATSETASQGGVKLERADSEYQHRLSAWEERSSTRKKENHTAGKHFTAYDPEGNAHTRFRAPSTAATSDVLIDLGPSPGMGRPGPARSDGRKFAKIPALKAPKKRVVYDYPLSSEEEEEAEDEDEDDSDSDDDGQKTETEDDGTNRSAIGKTKKKALPPIVDDDDDDDDYMKAL